MLLMIQWICLQPSGVYKHSDHAKIDYLMLEWSREDWGTGPVQQDYAILNPLGMWDWEWLLYTTEIPIPVLKLEMFHDGNFASEP